jgi:hypothetical protein
LGRRTAASSWIEIARAPCNAVTAAAVNFFAGVEWSTICLPEIRPLA